MNPDQMLLERIEREFEKAQADRDRYHAQCQAFDLRTCDYNQAVQLMEAKSDAAALAKRLGRILNSHRENAINAWIDAAGYHDGVVPFSMRVQGELRRDREGLISYDAQSRHINDQLANGNLLGAIQQHIAINSSINAAEDLRRIVAEHEAELSWLDKPIDQSRLVPGMLESHDIDRTMNAINASTAREAAHAVRLLPSS